MKVASLLAVAGCLAHWHTLSLSLPACLLLTCQQRRVYVHVYIYTCMCECLLIASVLSPCCCYCFLLLQLLSHCKCSGIKCERREQTQQERKLCA